VKVGFYSPLPPARTGVADYAATLLEALQPYGEIEVGPEKADVFLYHLGNNQIHREIYRRALARPGVVVLHDAVLQHLFLGSMTESEYVEEFTHNYGEWQRELARQLWRGRASSGFDARYYEYPMLKRVLEASRAVVVHNPAAARLVGRHCPSIPVIEIPHLFQRPELPAISEVLRFRQELEIPPRSFVFGVLGYLRESKRLLTILRALRTVRRACPDATLLVAGEFVSSDLARAAAPLLSQAGVFRAGYIEPRRFWRMACAVDSCINLRHPAAGETSGIAIRMMGIGKPVMVTAGLETAGYAETACFRIDPGVAERASLSDHMILAATFQEMAREVGRRAAAHIARRHSLEEIARRYWGILCAYRG
jgi:glycosyltransferase involved in cell wall biosynthesis